MNLDERIRNLDVVKVAVNDGYSESDDEIKQLIREVVDYVKPERDLRSINGKTYGQQGWNAAIDKLEAKVKELEL